MPDKPKPAEIDLFGLTHPGHVRKDNQDQFLIASLHKAMRVHYSSLPENQLGPLESDSRGYVFLVADGVGGGPSGKEASGTALQAVVEHCIHAMGLHMKLDPGAETEFMEDLRESVARSHEAIRRKSRDDMEAPSMATTLTLVAVRWPRAFMVHVGDSRCYRLRGERLELLTTDQTMAQAMLEAGVMSQETAEQSGLKHVLYSAVGGREAKPQVRAEDCVRGEVMMLCSDGLTKHVSDEEIRQQLLTQPTAEAMCRGLVDLALTRGGSDNVTVVAATVRARP